MHPVMQPVECRAAEVVRGVEPMGRAEMGQQGVIVVVKRGVIVRRRPFLRPFDLVLGELLRLLHAKVLPT